MHNHWLICEYHIVTHRLQRGDKEVERNSWLKTKKSPCDIAINVYPFNQKRLRKIRKQYAFFFWPGNNMLINKGEKKSEIEYLNI